VGVLVSPLYMNRLCIYDMYMMYICTVAENIAYGIEGASQEDVEEVIICVYM